MKSCETFKECISNPSVSSSWSFSTAKISLPGKPNYICSVATSMETRSHITSQAAPAGVSLAWYTPFFQLLLDFVIATEQQKSCFESTTNFAFSRAINQQPHKNRSFATEPCCAENFLEFRRISKNIEEFKKTSQEFRKMSQKVREFARLSKKFEGTKRNLPS